MVPICRKVLDRAVVYSLYQEAPLAIVGETVPKQQWNRLNNHLGGDGIEGEDSNNSNGIVKQRSAREDKLEVARAMQAAAACATPIYGMSWLLQNAGRRHAITS